MKPLLREDLRRLLERSRLYVRFGRGKGRV
jgi:hypothetical protein